MLFYTCENAWKDIHDYYHKELNNRDQELNSLARALLHIYNGSTPEKMEINCERCLKLLRKVADGYYIHF